MRRLSADFCGLIKRSRCKAAKVGTTEAYAVVRRREAQASQRRRWAFFIGRARAVARSEQIKARGRRKPEAYAYTLRASADRERRAAKLIGAALIAGVGGQ